ncbi:hypothetical protein MF406_01125 [Georgenia sp. TF02-10]|uniref:hypothetical protein n=1 Tax=Georgenia sp. TF02-10 TaxID=2917725 RepID=UPI001FA7FD91|nr:hypothetical protein [Georgenia sp. TF02-10]UNX54931.1 hypothetical protein MF406_01125 [Georgenia sp. TF02-10]
MQQDLLEGEALLERGALAMCARLRLRQRLEQIGRPTVVGAAALRVLAGATST